LSRVNQKSNGVMYWKKKKKKNTIKVDNWGGGGSDISYSFRKKMVVTNSATPEILHLSNSNLP